MVQIFVNIAKNNQDISDELLEKLEKCLNSKK